MKQRIILENGTLISLAEWQQMQGMKPHQIGRFFTVKEEKLRGEFTLAAPLVLLADKYRELKGKPVKINSAFRTKEKQEQLKKDGYRAAKYSPHCEGMAFDVDTISERDTRNSVKVLKKAAKMLGYKIRIGFESYLKVGNTFVHFDVCPMFFAPGMPFHQKKHPVQWEWENRW